MYKRQNGVDVQIGYIETHGRAGTVAMLEGLPVISPIPLIIFSEGKIFKALVAV